MKQRIVSIFPPEFHAHPAYWRAFTLAMVYLALAILQLFTFEKFALITAGYGLPGREVTAAFLAGLLPLLEIAALPYLLSMRVSQRTRLVSRAAFVATPLVWLVIAVWIMATGDMMTDSGLMGATITIPGGLWMIALTGIMAWAAYLVVRELPARRPK
jgi:hypothetical protein